MKAVIVIDVEEHGDYYVDVYRKDADDRFEGRYYFKPFPFKKYMRQIPLDVLEMGKRKRDFIIHKVDVDNSYAEGWNDCIDEIVGETE